MKLKKSLALLMAVISLFSIVLCCPITVSAKGEKHNPYYYSTTPTRALYYKTSNIMKGNDVKWLQSALNVLNNANLDIDGSFGKGTKAAVEKFQSNNGLSKDGSCGNATRAKIVDLLIKKGFVAEGTYVIETGLTSKSAVDISGGSTNNRANIQLYQKNNTHAQVFKVEAYDKWGWYSIRHASSGKSLDVAGGSSASGTNVQLYEWNKTDAQLWKFPYAGSGYSYIQNKLGCSLDVSGGQSANNTNIHMWSFNGSNAQKWKLVKASSTSSTAKYDLIWPVKGTTTANISGKYGKDGGEYHYRPINTSSPTRIHSGIDISNGKNGKNDILAVANGTVIFSDYTNARGYYIVIYHEDLKISSLYEHLYAGSKTVAVGDEVSAGQAIAKLGGSGKYQSGGQWRTYAAHLHFGLMSGKATSVDYDVWKINKTTNTFSPDSRYNKNISYTFK